MSDGVLVVGESLVDIVCRDDGSTQTFPGGSAANVAVTLARLGRGTGGFVTSYADDVRTGRYPQPEHGYAMPPDEAARLCSVLADRGATPLRAARTRRIG